MTGDLVAFLRARLDEDERVAQDGATMAGDQRWAARYHVITQKPVPGRSGETIAECAPFGGLYAAKHIARHDPARVLAEVDAKRRIIDEHRPMMPGWCSNCDVPGDVRGNLQGCQTLRLLALPYRDHPDYQPDWEARA